MAEERFKLPGSSYAELVKIIRAYGHAPDEAVPKDVADRASMDPTQVSRNNGFLISIGVISGGKKKSLTPPGRKLAQSLDFEMPEQIESAWRSIANENDFLRKIVSAVQIRGGMELSSLRNHVAYSAGAPKKPHAMAGAGSVIDILKAAGLLREEDGKIVVPSIVEEIPPLKEVEGQGLPSAPVASPVQQATEIVLRQAPVPTTISIQITIDCKPDDIEQLGGKLRRMLDSLAEDPKKSEACED